MEPPPPPAGQPPPASSQQETNTLGGFLNTITTTTANNNGILGGWATCNASDWAVGTTLTALAPGGYQADINPADWGTA